MLRMGFIEDVEEVMAELPESRRQPYFQQQCRNRFAGSHAVLCVNKGKFQSTQQTAPDITQSYWFVNGFKKVKH